MLKLVVRNSGNDLLPPVILCIFNIINCHENNMK